MRKYAKVPPDKRKAKIYFLIALTSFVAGNVAAALAGVGVVRMDSGRALAYGLGFGVTLPALFAGLDAYFGTDPTRWADKENDSK